MSYKVAVCGTGKAARAAVTALIEDFHNSLKEDTEFIVLLSEPQSDAAIHIGEWAADYELPYSAVMFATKMDTRQTGVWEAAADRYEISRASEIVKFLTERDFLVVAYDEEDEITMRAVSAALRKGVTVLDLTLGLSPVVISDEEDEDEEEPNAEVQLITDNNPLLDIRNALVDLVERIDAYYETLPSSQILAN